MFGQKMIKLNNLGQKIIVIEVSFVLFEYQLRNCGLAEERKDFTLKITTLRLIKHKFLYVCL